MLVAAAALPYSRAAALLLWGGGAAFTIGFAVWRTGVLWQGGRDPATTTPVLYLPTVAGGFVTSIVASALGFSEAGQMAFGAALFSWLAIESVLVQRLYTSPGLPASLRPTLGVQLAPATVGAVAYLGIDGGAPDLVAHALLCYGLLQSLILMRLLGWILEQPFTANYWGFTFGVTALATAAVRMAGTGSRPMAYLAPPLFLCANLIVGFLVFKTAMALFRGTLLPRAIPATATPS